ncbi:hypothetical protein Hanom_Chr10g00966721 [Helianthus anomalus]
MRTSGSRSIEVKHGTRDIKWIKFILLNVIQIFNCFIRISSTTNEDERT